MFTNSAKISAAIRIMNSIDVVRALSRSAAERPQRERAPQREHHREEGSPGGAEAGSLQVMCAEQDAPTIPRTVPAANSLPVTGQSGDGPDAAPSSTTAASSTRAAARDLQSDPAIIASYLGTRRP